MAKCKTPGAWFLFRAGQEGKWGCPTSAAEFRVSVPSHVVITESRAKALEKALHDAAENVMAKWFKTAIRARGAAHD